MSTLTIANPTVFSQVVIGGADRSADTLRVELWRTASAVGRWMAILRNMEGQYNNAFDIQNQFLIDVNGLANTLMQGRVDGPGVNLRAIDLESDWDEYAVITGVDQAQDMMFHNDFDHDYPDATQQIHSVINDIINVQLAGLTNITYTPPAWSPIAGSVQFREGAGLLATYQEMLRRAGWVSYVTDTLALRAGTPGFRASGVTLNSVAGDPTNNIIGIVDLNRRDGDKLYNYIKLYGKNPMFDGYSEQNASSWNFWPVGQGIDDTGTVRVGTYSQVVYNNNPANQVLRHRLTLPVFNYTTWNFSKGEIGAWCRYDNTWGSPGTPGAGSAPANEMVEIRLFDNAGRIANYYGESTRLYRGDWGFVSAKLGEKYDSSGVVAADKWFISFGAGGFDWENVVDFWFQFPRSNLAGNQPSHFYLDGFTCPLPCISVSQNAGAQTSYRRRPYVDAYSHISYQNALDEAADKFLDHHDSTLIDRIKLMTPGDLSLRYAAESVTINIPSLGISNAIFYITELHHIIEPYVDVSDGYGFDWVTEVEAVPISGIAYDFTRLREGPSFGASELARRSGVGLGIK